MQEDLINIIEEIKDFDQQRPINLLVLFAMAEEMEIPDEFIKLCKAEIENQECFKNKNLIKYLSGMKITKLLGIE